MLKQSYFLCVNYIKDNRKNICDKADLTAHLMHVECIQDCSHIVSTVSLNPYKERGQRMLSPMMLQKG